MLIVNHIFRIFDARLVSVTADRCAVRHLSRPQVPLSGMPRSRSESHLLKQVHVDPIGYTEAKVWLYA